MLCMEGGFLPDVIILMLYFNLARNLLFSQHVGVCHVFKGGCLPASSRTPSKRSIVVSHPSRKIGP